MGKSGGIVAVEAADHVHDALLKCQFVIVACLLDRVLSTRTCSTKDTTGSRWEA